MPSDHEPHDAPPDIKDAVLGRPDIGHVGLVTRVREAEFAIEEERRQRAEADSRLWKAIDTTTRRIDKIVWIAVGAGAGGALGGGGLVAGILQATGQL